MPLSSLVLSFNPARRGEFLAALAGIPEVSLLGEDGPEVAVLLETPEKQRELTLAEDLPRLPGCTGVRLILHVPDEAAFSPD